MDGLLACPVCELELDPGPRAYGCAQGHSFDVARQGYVNLAPAGSPGGDDAAMVAARADFLAGGWFDPLSAALAADAAEAAGPGAVAELGAGTGHHLAAVLDALDHDRSGVALDASVYAARRAARAHPRAISLVADAWGRLPLLDGSLGLALVVFAPRAGAEIARVLGPGGTLLAAVPSQRHLAELAGPLGLLDVDPAKDDRLHRALEPELQQVGSRDVEWTMSLDRTAAEALAAMGPSARHFDHDELLRRIEDLEEPVSVTGSVSLSRWRAAA